MSTSPAYTEPALEELLKRRDEKAFGYLYDHYAAALHGVIIRVLNNESVAADILQDVFVKIWRNIDSYDAGKGRLFTWMLNIARNTAIDVLRSKSYKYDRKIREIDGNVNVDSLSVSSGVDHIGLEKVLAGLTKEQRLIIDLAYFKGYTQEEIAKELDMPLGTVKTRIRNTLIQLRNILK